MKNEQNNAVPQDVCKLVAGVVLDRAVRSPVERRPARTADILPMSPESPGYEEYLRRQSQPRKS